MRAWEFRYLIFNSAKYCTCSKYVSLFYLISASERKALFSLLLSVYLLVLFIDHFLLSHFLLLFIVSNLDFNERGPDPKWPIAWIPNDVDEETAK